MPLEGSNFDVSVLAEPGFSFFNSFMDSFYIFPFYFNDSAAYNKNEYK